MTENTTTKTGKKGSKSLPVKLDYTLDVNTGLKATNRPKSDKLIHAHRYLDGLPGVKSVYKGV